MPEDHLFTSQICIADLLTRFPQVLPVFLNHKMTCIGCDMSVFDTLEDVSAVYHLDLEAFVVELRSAIKNSATL